MVQRKIPKRQITYQYTYKQQGICANKKTKKMKEGERIIQIVCNYFERDANEVKSPNQLRENVVPRQMSMYLMRRNTKLSLTEIGRHFIGRRGKPKDHSTVIHSVQTIETLIDCGWEYQGQEMMDHVEVIEKILKRKTEPTMIKLYRYA